MNGGIYEIIFHILNFFNAFQAPQIYGEVTTILDAILAFISTIPFNLTGVIFALLVLIAFVLIAVFNKRARIFAILAGAVNFLAVLLVPWWARMHHWLPFGGTKVLVWLKLIGIDIRPHELTPRIIQTSVLWAVRVINIIIAVSIILLGFILTTVCFIRCLKGKGKIVVILALVLNVLRLFTLPYQPIFVMLYQAVINRLFYIKTLQHPVFSRIIAAPMHIGQLLQIAIYSALILLPILLVLAVSIIKAIKEKKAKKLSLDEEKAEEITEQKDEEVPENSTENDGVSQNVKAQTMAEKAESEQ